MGKLYSIQRIAVRLDMACLIETQITKLKRELKEAEKSGKTLTVKKLKEKLKTLIMRLDAL